MITLLQGDCRELLPTLPANSVHCVVTSPPYLGLRDYGTAVWEGGDEHCDHTRQSVVSRASSGLDGAKVTQGGVIAWGAACGKCGARRIDAQLGLEASPEEYIATMVQVFREVRRVLRDDGTCWVNLGDSYAGNRPYQVVDSKHRDVGNNVAMRVPDGLKPKDLLMMPARLAIALQADGWWLRSDIIWAKPNPMPESVTDRPTSAHEHVFLLSKSARYFYDADVVRQPHLESSILRASRPWNGDAVRGDPLGRRQLVSGGRDEGAPMDTCHPNGRNLRNVWTIATHSFPDAHFATFPPELAERCIRAGTSERGCCAQCGAPWVRESGRNAAQPVVEASDLDRYGTGDAGVHRKIGSAYQKWLEANPVTTTGWSPSCKCGTQETKPATVLDCFAGAGTVGLVADRLQRDAVLIELNPAYCDMLRKRITSEAPLFANVVQPHDEDPEDMFQADLFLEAAQ